MFSSTPSSFVELPPREASRARQSPSSGCVGFRGATHESCQGQRKPQHTENARERGNQQSLRKQHCWKVRLGSRQADTTPDACQEVFFLSHLGNHAAIEVPWLRHGYGVKKRDAIQTRGGGVILLAEVISTLEIQMVGCFPAWRSVSKLQCSIEVSP